MSREKWGSRVSERCHQAAACKQGIETQGCAAACMFARVPPPHAASPSDMSPSGPISLCEGRPVGVAPPRSTLRAAPQSHYRTAKRLLNGRSMRACEVIPATSLPSADTHRMAHGHGASSPARPMAVLPCTSLLIATATAPPYAYHWVRGFDGGVHECRICVQEKSVDG